jgi:hypothetical protein
VIELDQLLADFHLIGRGYEGTAAFVFQFPQGHRRCRFVVTIWKVPLALAHPAAPGT